MSWRQLMRTRKARVLALGAGKCYGAMGFAQRLSVGFPLQFRLQSWFVQAHGRSDLRAQRVTDGGQSGLPDTGGGPTRLRQFEGLRRSQQGVVCAATVGRRSAGSGNDLRVTPVCFAGIPCCRSAENGQRAGRKRFATVLGILRPVPKP